MTSTPNQTNACEEIFEKRGKEVIEAAKSLILTSNYDNGLISSSLRYFAKKTLCNALPVFPALTSLSCEAAGGDPRKTFETGVALTLIAAAADIHDDIIDKSARKYSKMTVFGKYGADIGILAGDVLLMQGMSLLNKSNKMSAKQKTQLFEELFNSFIVISKAEAYELKFRENPSLALKKHQKIIQLKSSVPEMHCRIGALLGDADETFIDKMGKFGLIIGNASLIIEEFADTFDFEELQRRFENEYLPLPILHALENAKGGGEISKILSKKVIESKDFQYLLELTIKSEEVINLSNSIKGLINSELDELDFINDKNIKREASRLLTGLLANVRDCLDVPGT